MNRLSPVGQLIFVIVVALFAIGVTVGMTCRTPWLGQGELKRVGSIVLEANDRVEDPDVLDREPSTRFFERQTLLANEIAQSQLEIERADGSTTTVVPSRTRPVGTLPGPFWFLLFVGAFGFLSSAWVFILRPKAFAARMFALTGMMLMISAYSSAIYGAREIAMTGSTFRHLSQANHGSAAVFGCALVALFLSYPNDVGPKWLRALPFAIFVPVFVAADLFELASPVIGMYVPVLIETLATLVLVFVQWRKSRPDPRARGALRWLGLGAASTAALFTGTMAIPAILGTPPLLSQAYAFGAFLFLYAGLALGLRRYRLFDLEEWSFRILFWGAAGIAFLLFDALLAVLLGLGQRAAAGAALFVCAFGYLPLRTWLSARAAGRRRRDPNRLFRSILELAFVPSHLERAEAWRALVKSAFDPLEIADTKDVADVRIEREGLELLVPATSSAPALSISYPWNGRSVFGPADVAFAQDLVALASDGEKHREAYERGAREERRRIARDLHDDLGARLLSGLHQDDVGGTHDTIRHAIADMRAIVTALAGEDLPLGALLADVRHETAQRLSAAGITLDCPFPEFPPTAALSRPASRHYVSIVREVVSNVIRHAGAKQVTMRWQEESDALVTTIADDGEKDVILAPREGGFGLSNLRARAESTGGSMTWSREAGATQFVVRLPVRRLDA